LTRSESQPFTEKQIELVEIFADQAVTQAEPLHRQSRSNAALDRTGKNNSNQWS